ncbi:MAG: DUF3365 domain-containing protein, partial [Gemmatimonadota bacterium]|nr:DUF3365 domain-containing protein [Gemmatimonadota bacterium]
SKDADITNALGRQRMLTQAMGKSALGYSASKSRQKNIEQQITTLDRYVTQMRGTYTKYVVAPAKKNKLGISMNPDAEPHPSVPFPATFTRLVNEKVGKDSDVKITIISENPINKNQGLKTSMDHEANQALKGSSDEVFSKVYEKSGKLYMTLYTADKASLQVCASCHNAMMGTQFKVGDMLGIRRYDMVFANNATVGRAELNATLDEYNVAKTVFEETLNAVKSGGKYPADLSLKNYKNVDRIDDLRVQGAVGTIENEFKDFTKYVDLLVSSKVGSDSYREAKSKIMVLSNQLRKVSDDLVAIYTDIANGNQENIQWAVNISSLVTFALLLGLGYFLTRMVLNPIKIISEALKTSARET